MNIGTAMDPIYLDHAATTPVRDEVRRAMEPFLHRSFGNPSSTHRWGREAAAALADARHAVADALGARFSEILFTRGGTESDNLAIRGWVRSRMDAGQRPSVVTTAVEHKAVLDAARAAAGDSHTRPVVLPVASDGSVDTAALDRALEGGPTLLSAMWVNNETGMILDVPGLAGRVDAAGGVTHTDAVQAVGKVPVDVARVPVDLLTVTGHKIYGPKGTGALFVRRGVEVAPLLVGGGQERGVRPGTEDVAGAVGLATALRLAVEEREDEARRLEALRRELEARLTSTVDGLRVNAGEAPRAPHVSSVAVSDMDGQSLLMALDLEGVAASGGSACQSGAGGGSHVVRALYGEDDRRATVRFSLGRGTTADEVDRAAEVTAAVVARLRQEVPA